MTEVDAPGLGHLASQIIVEAARELSRRDTIRGKDQCVRWPLRVEIDRAWCKVSDLSAIVAERMANPQPDNGWRPCTLSR